MNLDRYVHTASFMDYAPDGEYVLVADVIKLLENEHWLCSDERGCYTSDEYGCDCKRVRQLIKGESK